MMESLNITGYNPTMNEFAPEMNVAQSTGITGFLKSHAALIALISMMLVALPAYLTAMEGQFIDMEFLASLCGISGWGS